MPTDNQIRSWARELYGTETLYKDVPVGGLFYFPRSPDTIFCKRNRGFSFADGRVLDRFRTGTRTAVVRVDDPPSPIMNDNAA